MVQKVKMSKEIKKDTPKPSLLLKKSSTRPRYYMLPVFVILSFSNADCSKINSGRQLGAQKESKPK